MSHTPKPKPVGELKYHHTDVTQNKLAIYVDTYLVDEEGNLWGARSSAFRFALVPAGKAGDE